MGIQYCNFDIPKLTLYSYAPVFIICILAGIYILIQDRKNPINRNLFFFILIFSLWVINDYFQWFIHSIWLNLFLARLSILVFFAILFFVFFVYSFIGKNLSFYKKLLFSLPFIPIIILLFTDYNLSMFISENCTTESGLLYYYVYALTIIYTILIVSILLYQLIRKEATQTKKDQIKLIVAAISILIIWFIFFNRVYFDLESLTGGQAGWVVLLTPYGMIFFIGIITYTITRYGLFNIKFIGTQALVVALIALVGSTLFVNDMFTIRIIIRITLALVVLLGWLLVRSVKFEVQRKEELENLSTQLAAANDKLHALDKAKSEFISIASHQLRTPLTSIKGFGSLLLEGTYGAVPEAQRNALEKIYVSNERLIQLVEDLLNISRIEAGRMEFDFQEAQIEDLVKEAVDTLELSAKDKGLYLDYQKPNEPLPKIKIDITKIKEVISNMVDNAIKYTQRGGVTVRAGQANYWDAEEKKQKNTIRVVVSDTGIGMDREEVDMIFQKFQRGREVSHYHTEGTGLGMYIGKKVVEVHKGKIWAESKGKGKGSRFILELPVNVA